MCSDFPALWLKEGNVGIGALSVLKYVNIPHELSVTVAAAAPAAGCDNEQSDQLPNNNS